jgi:hypothetical protein
LAKQIDNFKDTVEFDSFVGALLSKQVTELKNNLISLGVLDY